MVYAGDSKSPGGNPVRVRLSPRAFTHLSFVALALPARAQTFRGSVVSATSGQPLSYSIVALLPGFDQRFTDVTGRFEFRAVQAGRYHLIVRQIGYSPLDTAIVVGPDSMPPVRLALQHLAIELPAMVVTAPQTCITPGAPDSAADPRLAAVFGQVLENARRLRLLIDSFPFEYRLLRTTWTVDRDGHQNQIRRDTLTHETEQGWTYRPGRLVAWRSGPAGRERFVRLPTLTDFADSVFVGAHCFWLAGRDSIGGDSLIRLDFAPPNSFRSTDVAGTAYLDPATYQLRYTMLRLTRPERELRDVTSLVATTHFREIAPAVSLHDHVRAVTTLRGGPPEQRIEEQWLLTVNFRRPLVR